MPSSREAWKPHVPDRKLLVEGEEEPRWKQKGTFDRHHRAWDMSPALPGDLIWIPDRREQGTIGVGAISHVANNDSILKFYFNQFIQSSVNQCISTSVQ